MPDPEHAMSRDSTLPMPDSTEAQRRLALLTADAILRHAERGDWDYILVLARSLLRTAVDAQRNSTGRDRRGGARTRGVTSD